MAYLNSIPQNSIVDKAIFWLIIYFLASVVGDVLSFPLGPTSVTPNQLVVLVSIFSCIRYINTSIIEPVFKKLLLCLGCLVIFTAIYASVSMLINEIYKFTVISMALNYIWLVVVGGLLCRGLSKSQEYRIYKWFLIIGMIPIITGLIEFIRGDYLFQHSAMAKGMAQGGSFVVRGTHADRIDYVSDLVPCLFIAFAIIQQQYKGFNKIILFIYLMIGIFLVAVTGSFTGTVGLLSGLFFMLILNPRRCSNILLAASFTALGFMFFTVFLQSDMGKKQIDSWNLKYTRQVEQYETKNFRYWDTRLSIEEFIHNPIFGIGLNQHGFSLMKALKENRWRASHSILRIPAEMGIFGIIPLGCVLYIYYSQLIKMIIRRRLYFAKVMKIGKKSESEENP
jgi:hypothetical protein